MNPIIFTIVSNNYLSYAATLMQSVRSVMPKTRRFIFLCDEALDVDVDCAAQLIPVSTIMGPVLADMVLRYSILEINTAVKPFIFRSLFRNSKSAPILYLDPDILVLSPLAEVLKALNGPYELVLTPHLTAPLEDDKEPSDHTIMKSGIWNLGFAALRKSPDTVRLVDWWCKKCETQCLSDVANNLFTDQRWMDMAPAFVKATKLLMHLGYNVAYWNLPHRKLACGRGDSWRVNRTFPLRFFHFSGIVPNDPGVVSKHQNRIMPEHLGELSRLFDAYRAALMRNRWQQLKAIPYAYGFTKGKRRIADITRPYFRDLYPHSVASKFRNHKQALQWYARWLAEPAPEHNLGLPRVMVAVARARPDVARAFDNSTAAGAKAYANWFREKATLECGIAPEEVELALLQAGRDALEAEAPAASERHSVGELIARVSRLEIDGFAPPPPTSGLTAWLRRPIAIGEECELPLALLLPMCARKDLRSHFPLTRARDVFRYLVWLFSNGVQEHCWHRELTAAFFDACSPLIQGFDGELPAQRLMALGGGISPLVSIAAEQYDGGFGPLAGDGTPWSSPDNVARTLSFVYRRFLGNGAFPLAASGPVEAFLFGAQRDVDARFGLQLPVFVHTVWAARPDLRALFPGGSRESWLGLIGWFVLHGRLEYLPTLELARLPGFWSFLASASADIPSFNNLQAAIFHARPDVSKLMEAGSAAGRGRFHDWLRLSAHAEYSFDRELAQLALHEGAPADAQAGAAATRVHPLAPGIDRRIRLIGHFELPSGRAEDARTLAAALESAGYEVDRIERSEAVAAGARRLRQKAAVAIHVLNADTAFVDWVWREAVGAIAEINVGFWAWELEAMPPAWRYAYAFYDELWGNSQFCARALQGQDLRPVRPLPLAVAAISAARAGALELKQVADEDFCFLVSFDFKSFHERKNPLGAVAAFQRAFPSGTEPVALVIKTLNAEAAPLAWQQLAKRCAPDRRITLLNQAYTRAGMDALFARADAYVSLHRAEGFGRGLAEALLRSTPVIATAYSGSDEICRANTAYLVDYRLKPIEPGEYVDDAVGLMWAEPDIDSAARAMREVLRHQDQAKVRARRGRALVQQQYSVPAIGKLADRYLRALFERGSGTAPALRATHAAGRRARGDTRKLVAG